jgi:hypothetical protein
VLNPLALENVGIAPGELAVNAENAPTMNANGKTTIHFSTR